VNKDKYFTHKPYTKNTLTNYIRLEEAVAELAISLNTCKYLALRVMFKYPHFIVVSWMTRTAVT